MTELSSGELDVKAAMEAELSCEDKNGDFALTVAQACLALQTRRGGRWEHGEANCKMEAAMAH